MIGSDPIALAADATSGLRVTFTSPTFEVCVIIDGRVVWVAEGVCIVVASQEGDDEWAAAPPAWTDCLVIVGIGALRPKPAERFKSGDVITVSFQLRNVRGRRIVPSRIEIAR